MSLVAYECSDESEDEQSEVAGLENSSENVTSNNVCNGENKPNSSSISNDSVDHPKSNELQSFLALPVPKYHNFQMNPVNRQRVKISIPSLAEFEEEEEDLNQPQKKKIKKSEKGSGLFALLPSPKSNVTSTTLFKPRQITSAAKLTPSPETKYVPTDKLKKVKTSTIMNYSSDEEEEENNSNESADFFSLSVENEPVPVAEDDNGLHTNSSTESKHEIVTSTIVRRSSLRNGYENFSPLNNMATTTAYEQSNSTLPNDDNIITSDNVSPTNSEALNLDQNAIEQLCGRRGKNQKRENIQFIDLHEDTILEHSKQLLTKNLTEDTAYRSSHKKQDGPSSTQKRKHQITYLAHQAKEREMELKNQWANSRLSKKQTQSKYGF